MQTHEGALAASKKQRPVNFQSISGEYGLWGELKARCFADARL
jgi:hypothetical protein